MPSALTVPSPPAFLDPLTDIESSFYYAIPKFFGQNHPNTRWLIAMIKNSEEDRLKHKLETSPGAFKGVYYQMMDHPQLYIPEDVAAVPMFKRQAVVYLTAVGMAMYLGNTPITELLLSYRDPYDDLVCDACEPQYASHLQDKDIGDFHAFPPFVVMMRRLSFTCATALLKAGWNTTMPIAMPMRRKFERRVIYYRDWLEVALSILAARPMYPLQVLLREVTKSTIYKPVKMPMDVFKPPDPANAEPFGLINVDQLPPSVQMIGVRSLLDMAEHYDRYRQMRECARQVAALKREAAAVGLNPEILMIQAQDFDAGSLPPPLNTEGSNVMADGRGANNSSAAEDMAVFGSQHRHVVLNVNMSAAGKGKGKPDADGPYTSEGCRILHYALTRDPRGKSMQPCLEAFCLLLKRGFYLVSQKPEIMSPVARDVRNTTSLLLNLIQREQAKVDKIVDKIKSGKKRFPHLEEHKQLENRKTACIIFMSKLVGVLTKLLLQSKTLVAFIQADFPPFPSNIVNFELNPYLAQKFQEIKFGIIREFNACKDSWVYLNKEMLETVSGITEMQLHFKVGKKPTIIPKAGAKGKNKNKSNMSNTNSCFVSYTRVQRRPKRQLAVSSSSALAAASAPSVTATLAPLLTGDDGSSTCLHMESSAESYISKAVSLPKLSNLAKVQSELLPLVTPDAAVFPANSSCCGSMLEEKQQNPSPPHKQQQKKAPKEPAALVEGDNPARPTADMEQLLASLCREVDSLFRPLECLSGNPEPQWTSALDEKPFTAAATTASRSAVPGCTNLSSEVGVAQSHHEYSTIEPDLAPTPMPTPEPSPAPGTVDAAVVSTTNAAAASAAAAAAAAITEDCDLESCEIAQGQRRRRRRPIPLALRRRLKQSGVLRLLSRMNASGAELETVMDGSDGCNKTISERWQSS